MSPWGLSPAQARAMDAMCAEGCYKLACRATGWTPKTLECHLREAGKRMGSRTVIGKYLAWDRWRRGA